MTRDELNGQLKHAITLVGDDPTGAVVLVLCAIARELHEANEQNKGVGVWRECVTRALTELCRYFGRRG